MINQDCELDAFKREIDLRQFAESLGYQIDRRESWRGSAVLRCGADKIVVKRNGNGHYVFFSLRDDDDNGTVIDFVQRRQHLSLGAVRQVLRPWIGRSASAPQLPVSAGIKWSHFRRCDWDPVPPEMAIGHTSAQTAARSSGWTSTYFSQL